jgi:hypothetical protein
MNEEEIIRLKYLIDKLETVKGAKIYEIINSFTITHYSVSKNYIELLSFIEGYEITWTAENGRKNLISSFKELSRLFHNYHSSVYSLNQHNIKLYKDLESPQLEEEYNLLKKQVLDSNIVFWFVKDLRRLAQHVSLPELLSSHNRKHYYEKFETTVQLDKEKLLKWDDWSSPSKRFIDANEAIALKGVVMEYQILISKFYGFFYKKLFSISEEKLKKFFTLQREMDKILRK